MTYNPRDYYFKPFQGKLDPRKMAQIFDRDLMDQLLYVSKQLDMDPYDVIQKTMTKGLNLWEDQVQRLAKAGRISVRQSEEK